MTFDGTCERGGFQRAPQETEKIPPARRLTCALLPKVNKTLSPMAQRLSRRTASATGSCLLGTSYFDPRVRVWFGV
jgi:hypothetical protein